MTTSNQLFRYTLLTLCLTFASHATMYGQATPAPSAADSASDVERDFDTIRGFDSYDPHTDRWSSIEDFEGVEILEDPSQQREEHYLYHSFWAYDALRNVWYKVDIRDHGYQLEAPAISAPPVKPAKEKEKKPRKPLQIWKNLVLGLSMGGGINIYHNKVENLHLSRSGTDWYLQTDQEKQNDQHHTIHWLGGPYHRKGRVNSAMDNQVEKGKKIAFKGVGGSFPITLTTHYTLFKRLRLGGGGSFELNYVEALKPTQDARAFPTLSVREKERLFYGIEWFGLIGYKFIQRALRDFVLDLRIGQSFNRNSDFQQAWTGRHYIYKGEACSLGVSYERKLNDFFRFVMRFAVDGKRYYLTPMSLDDKKAKVTLYQITPHIDLGINFNFGRDAPPKKSDDQEKDPEVAE